MDFVVFILNIVCFSFGICMSAICYQSQSYIHLFIWINVAVFNGVAVYINIKNRMNK